MRQKYIRHFAGLFAFLMLVTANPLSLKAQDTNSETSTTPETIVDDVIQNLEGEKEEGMLEKTVDEAIRSLDDSSKDRLINAVKGVEKRIREQTRDFRKQLRDNPGKAKEIRQKIEELQKVNRKLRSKAIQKDSTIIEDLKTKPRQMNLYEVRWGNLTRARQKCTSIGEELIRKSLNEGGIPKACIKTDNKQTYKGVISVDKGTLKIRKPLLFEKNDQFTEEAGSAVSFESVINGHWDGMILQYFPENKENREEEATSDNKVQITVSIGDLNETYAGAEIFGRKDIGNHHHIEFKPLARLFSGISKEKQNEIIENKIKIKEKMGRVQQKMEEVRLLSEDGNEVKAIEEVLEEMNEYNFDDITAAEIEAEMDLVVADLDQNQEGRKIRNQAQLLKRKLSHWKEKAKERKYQKKLIPFKDTDDDDWFTEFVSKAKNRGIFNGYKDKEGNALGEFRPGNHITVAEILKVGLEASGKGESEEVANPTLEAAAGHWAKRYVKRAEELKLDLVREKKLDLNRPATRGEVIRMMLETLDIKPEKVTKTDFSDVSMKHRHAAYIQYAKSLGIVSGDSGKTTFRPDEPINRAEASKIADQMMENIVGNTITE